jgi:CheY-like chemotaxis protein
MEPVVLVVDDSKLAWMVVSGILSRIRLDCAVIEAGSEEQALATLGQQRVDAALIDYNMPDTNGIELASHIRALNPDLPIAIISANAQFAILDAARALNATFIEKPLSDGVLAPFISGVALRQRREDT